MRIAKFSVVAVLLGTALPLVAGAQAPASSGGSAAPPAAAPARDPGLYMTFQTDKGSIACKLYEKEAPNTVRTMVGLETEQDFRNLVIERGEDGHLVRLGELADVRLAAENERSYSRLNGVPGLMQMYAFGPPAFSAFSGGDDASVVYHEYAHGLSNRLVTDAQGRGALGAAQPGAMGEGWSDYYALDYLEAQDLIPPAR